MVMTHNRQKIKTKGHAVQKLDCKTDRHNKISDYRLLSTIGRGGVKNTHTRLTALFQVSWYQKGKTNLDFTEARDSEWQWHQLGHMQVGTSLQTDNHASTSPLSFFTGRTPFLPPAQPTASNH